MSIMCIRVKEDSSAKAEAAALILIEDLSQMFDRNKVHYRRNTGPNFVKGVLVYVYIDGSMNVFKRLFTMFRIRRKLKSRYYKHHTNVEWSMV